MRANPRRIILKAVNKDIDDPQVQRGDVADVRPRLVVIVPPRGGGGGICRRRRLRSAGSSKFGDCPRAQVEARRSFEGKTEGARCADREAGYRDGTEWTHRLPRESPSPQDKEETADASRRSSQSSHSRKRRSAQRAYKVGSEYLLIVAIGSTHPRSILSPTRTTVRPLANSSSASGASLAAGRACASRIRDM